MNNKMGLKIKEQHAYSTRGNAKIDDVRRLQEVQDEETL